MRLGLATQDLATQGTRASAYILFQTTNNKFQICHAYLCYWCISYSGTDAKVFLRINLRQNNLCCCPGSPCCQVISSHCIDYVGWMGFCLLPGRSSTTCTILMLMIENQNANSYILCCMWKDWLPVSLLAPCSIHWARHCFVWVMVMISIGRTVCQLARLCP